MALTSRTSALHGLRVLDLAGEKGAFCGKLLADMGADVIKVEPPGGDEARSIGPFWLHSPHVERSLSFWYSNTSKRGITLDLNASTGQELFRNLSCTADIVLDTYVYGHLGSCGLGYETLSKVNPRLIVTSISDFGQTGPYSDYRSCDLVTSALGGHMYVCGGHDTPPLRPYGEQSYLVASIYGAIGTLMALRCRHISGRGQHVDISMQECCTSVIEHINVRYLYEGIVARRQGSLHWDNAFRVFPCRDGLILLSLFQEWDTVVEWLDSEGMAGDLKEERWRDGEVWRREAGHVIEVLERWTLQHTVEELMEQGQLMRLPWGAVNTVADISNNAQLLERGFFVQISHPTEDVSVSYPGAPYILSRTPWRVWRRAPLIGEHNREILSGELGIPEAKLVDLASQGVI